ncbi:unnamed protein product [Didymodactylos carnosus]|uniref:Fibronectin type-III domain-containing protein n=1 Tax=Didymodactylos carnosus TaxID=1234261 RepID=A0A814FD47_9BILA|nr:unnamed protein product [Didymodactylos carnosus]CAF3751718.1 unnamed protein product [Didymodactylos carnosus]
MQHIVTSVIVLVVLFQSHCQDQNWIIHPASLNDVKVVNSTTLNISWIYHDESEPSLVRLTIDLYNLASSHKNVEYQYVFAMNGTDRRNYSSIVLNHSLKPNTYYSVCFEAYQIYHSNASSTTKTCRVTKTVLPTVIPTEQKEIVTDSNSVTVSLLWPRELPYTTYQMNVQLNGRNTSLPISNQTSNITFLIQSFQFNNLSSSQEYRIKSTFEYWIDDIPLTKNTLTIEEIVRTRAPTGGNNLATKEQLNTNVMIFVLLNLVLFFIHFVI